jgi:hypothetical protein
MQPPDGAPALKPTPPPMMFSRSGGPETLLRLSAFSAEFGAPAVKPNLLLPDKRLARGNRDSDLLGLAG